ncbi:probable serine/threonine-protein kinase fhkB [Pseudomyrmex gracilis]|uniref:probable serine/threonine-protein kinase fhkB n=1 Tax=Pseudomyrmex gracilis TaxID=219809 RepID=UPI000995DDBB|nr:probable serine/threonine-protein kinase fhkB [Pseudomyrmex gracilis]
MAQEEEAAPTPSCSASWQQQQQQHQQQQQEDASEVASVPPRAEPRPWVSWPGCRQCDALFQRPSVDDDARGREKKKKAYLHCAVEEKAEEGGRRRLEAQMKDERYERETVRLLSEIKSEIVADNNDNDNNGVADENNDDDDDDYDDDDEDADDNDADDENDDADDDTDDDRENERPVIVISETEDSIVEISDGEAGDFDLNDKERPSQSKKFEDNDLDALLNEDSCQTLQELSTSLGVDLSTVGNRLKSLDMIQKEGY